MLGPWILGDVAHAHGGEDHDAPIPTGVVTTGDGWSASSTEFEAVLRLPRADVGQTVDGRLYLADFATSAPVSDAQVQLRLAGAADVALAPTPAGTPGVWTFPVTLPTAGDYTAQLQVITEQRADALGSPPHALGPSPVDGDAHAPLGWGALLAAMALGAVVGGGVVALVRRRRAPPAALVAVLVAAVALAVAPRVVAHEGEDHAAPAAAPPSPAGDGGTLLLPIESQFLLGLRTTPARTGLVEERVEALGFAESPPGDRAEVTAPVPGWLDFGEVSLEPGALVQRGQALGRIVELPPAGDRSAAATARAQAFVELAEARRAEALAARDAARIDELAGVISGREAVDRQRALDVARARVAEAEALVATLGRDLPTTVLRAPISGRVASIWSRPGDLVQPGDLLLRLVVDEPLWVRVNLPTALAGRVLADAGALVVADARPDLRVEGRVLDAGHEADPLTGTTLVTVALPDAVQGIVPGATVRAALDLGTAHRGLLVPDAAVVDAAGQTLVFVKVGPESFVERPVRVGARSGDDREVLEGLEAGERVVVQSTYALRSLAGR